MPASGHLESERLLEHTVRVAIAGIFGPPSTGLRLEDAPQSGYDHRQKTNSTMFPISCLRPSSDRMTNRCQEGLTEMCIMINMEIVAAGVPQPRNAVCVP